MTPSAGAQVVVLDEHVLVFIVPGIPLERAAEMAEMVKGAVPEWQVLVLPWAATVTDLRDNPDLSAAAAALGKRIRDRLEAGV